MRYFGLLFAALLLTACGQKGPLYLPEGQAPVAAEHDDDEDDRATSQFGQEK